MKLYKRSIFLTYLHSKLLVNSSIGSFLTGAAPLCWCWSMADLVLINTIWCIYIWYSSC